MKILPPVTLQQQFNFQSSNEVLVSNVHFLKKEWNSTAREPIRYVQAPIWRSIYNQRDADDCYRLVFAVPLAGW